MSGFFDRLDRRLCVRLRPVGLRRWWCNLWLRKDELHPCYRTDTDYTAKLDAKIKKLQAKRDEILLLVVRRRQEAHERENAPFPEFQIW